MILQSLHILNYKNIREADLRFSDKLNCLVGLNGQGKTNILDAIYLLSFAKSAYTTQDSLCITHDEDMALVQGTYTAASGQAEEDEQITCGLKRGQKKHFRRGAKEYKRLIDHIGRIPLVMVSPRDQELVEDGSDERRRFMDMVLSQIDHRYLEELTAYNLLLKQRNALLKQYEDAPAAPDDLLEVLEMQMVPRAEYIYRRRSDFMSHFVPLFDALYREIAGTEEHVNLVYTSQLQDRDLTEAFVRTRQRDLILGWTSQGIHKDDLEMLLSATNEAEAYPLKRVGSQGQQKTFLLAMKLAQALYLSDNATVHDAFDGANRKGAAPILLLDDIFDKLDSERVARLIRLVESDRFGQVFLTDTDRQHLTDLIHPTTGSQLFYVNDGKITQ